MFWLRRMQHLQRHALLLRDPLPSWLGPAPAPLAWPIVLFSSFMWLSKHSFWRINRNVSILDSHTHTHTHTCLPACMTPWPSEPLPGPMLLLVLDSSANFPVDVGIFSVCHLNCLITWIDCEKRATAAAAAAKATVTAIVTATYTREPARAGGESTWVILLSKESHGLKLTLSRRVWDVYMSNKQIKNGQLLPLCFSVVVNGFFVIFTLLASFKFN